jgi:radical SAM protein with 4Fe4S-binding SPASM domain
MTHLGDLMRRAEQACQPVSVLVELTWWCPLGCRHCYCESPGEELETADWTRVLGEVREAGALFVTFSGGEPLARTDALEIAGAARQLGLGVRLLTSGQLLDGETARRIAALGFLSVELSLYGATAATHNAVTRLPSSFDRTLAAARALRALGVPVMFKVPLLAPTLPEATGILALARSLGAGCGFDPIIVPRRTGARDPLALRPEAVALAATLDALARELPAPKRAPAATLAECQSLCTAGTRTARIAPDGTVHACVLYTVPAGNVRQQSFGEIWRTSPELRRLRARTPRDLAPECQACPDWQRCGRCSAAALLEHGDDGARLESACAVARAAAAARTTARPVAAPAARARRRATKRPPAKRPPPNRPKPRRR